VSLEGRGGFAASTNGLMFERFNDMHRIPQTSVKKKKLHSTYISPSLSEGDKQIRRGPRPGNPKMPH